MFFDDVSLSRFGETKFLSLNEGKGKKLKPENVKKYIFIQHNCILF